MNPHTKLRILTSNTIGDMHRSLCGTDGHSRRTVRLLYAIQNCFTACVHHVVAIFGSLCRYTFEYGSVRDCTILSILLFVTALISALLNDSTHLLLKKDNKTVKNNISSEIF